MNEFRKYITEWNAEIHTPVMQGDPNYVYEPMKMPKEWKIKDADKIDKDLMVKLKKDLKKTLDNHRMFKKIIFTGTRTRVKFNFISINGNEPLVTLYRDRNPKDGSGSIITIYEGRYTCLGEEDISKSSGYKKMIKIIESALNEE